MFVKLGWRPPPLTDRQALRLIEDIQLVDSWARATNDLSPSQLRTLERAAYGDTVHQIASELAWAHDTVKTTHAHARQKLGARNITNAVAIAIDQGIIHSASGWREAA